MKEEEREKERTCHGSLPTRRLPSPPKSCLVAKRAKRALSACFMPSSVSLHSHPPPPSPPPDHNNSIHTPHGLLTDIKPGFISRRAHPDRGSLRATQALPDRTRIRTMSLQPMVPAQYVPSLPLLTLAFHHALSHSAFFLLTLKDRANGE